MIKNILACLAIFLPSIVRAQDAAEMSESLLRVSQYQLSQITDDGGTDELKLVSQSLLNWSNPVYGTTDGALFFWTDKQSRPVVALKTYKTSKGRWFEQVRSFCTRRVVGKEGKDGEVFWSPDRGAPAMKELAGAPVPRDSETLRLVQMKAIHRGFNVTGMINKKPQLLRAYPRPLYRYKSDEIIDGAVMGFVQGTGPDVLLMLEARKVDGTAKWFYSLGSVGIFAIDVTYKDESVWKEARRGAPETRPTGLYDGRRLAE